MNYTFEILKIGFYLLVVVGIIYFLSVLFKKNVLSVQSSKHLKLIDKLYMGSKTGLFLIEVNDEIILISQTENKIEKLDKWKKVNFDFDIEELRESNESKQAQFKEFFMKYLGRNDSDSDQ
ncbi:MAG TPA: flagellar biosynthetic protein FliO [Halanaerobiales bacterium]|nr:flagellar biosynthetic protein FliO [Halanaerobiales bacterium]